MSLLIRLGLVLVAGVVVAAAVGGRWWARSPSPEQADPSSIPGEPSMVTSKIAESKSGKVERATFGAGCFWGVEATFRQTPGVLGTAVGYAGGKTENPTYHQVCSDTTGHAEVVHVEFDPEQVSYAKLLDVFFANHNPTTLNSQGPDFGSQYRSVIFHHDDTQRAAAEEAKRKLGESGRWGRPIVTQIVPFTAFYPAEDYHQQYLEKRGMASCHR